MIDKINILVNVIFTVILLYISINDFRKKKITNRSLAVLLLIGIGAACQLQVTVLERILGVLVTGTPLLLLDLILPGAFGGGDIKLLAIAGGLLGWRGGLLALCAGFLSGGFYSAVMLVLGKIKRKDKFAFGPFLCIGIAIGYCIIFVNSQSSGLTVY